VTAELAAAAAAASNLATSNEAEATYIEEHLPSPTLDPYSPQTDGCGWGCIVKKYNSRSTNRYLNLVVSRDVENSFDEATVVVITNWTLEHILITHVDLIALYL
jgi:hypothetical protein